MTERQLVRLDNMPAYQNRMFDTPQDARNCPRGDLVLSQDCESGLIRNIAFDPSKLTYDVNYQNEQGHSPFFQQHLSSVLHIIQRHFSNSRILEVGCGKGLFLDRLREAGYDALGVDPAYEGTSPYIERAEFTPGSNLRREAIVMRHVLEHVPDPAGFLDMIRRANGGTGLIYIEVPCFDWILRNHAWFDLFYEHVNYFRAGDFRNFFGNVLELGHLFGGQYLYAVADLASLREPRQFAGGELVEFPMNFFAGLETQAGHSQSSSMRIVWGCGAKGVMFAHHLTQRGFRLDLAVDLNPAKQGKYLASSGIPVLSPEQGLALAGDGGDIFVMNSNYLTEIKSVAGTRFNFIPVDAQ